MLQRAPLTHTPPECPLPPYSRFLHALHIPKVVEQDTTTRTLGLACPIPTLVVQVVLVDGQTGSVRLATQEAFPLWEPQQCL